MSSHRGDTCVIWCGSRVRRPSVTTECADCRHTRYAVGSSVSSLLNSTLVLKLLSHDGVFRGAFFCSSISSGAQGNLDIVTGLINFNANLEARNKVRYRVHLFDRWCCVGLLSKAARTRSDARVAEFTLIVSASRHRLLLQRVCRCAHF